MGRRGENIYKRKDGRWEGRYISGYGVDGKAKYSYVYARSYSEVKTKLLSAHNAYSVSTRKSNKHFGDWMDEWLLKKQKVVKESTYIRYRNMIENHIRPALGKYPIDKISTELVEQFVLSASKCGRLDNNGGLSPKSINDMLVVLREVFKFTHNSGVNSICDLSQVMIRKSQREMRVLSISEEKRLITVLMSETDRYKIGVYICLFTGIRIGELCALRWEHISFEEKTLTVKQTMQRLQNSDSVSIAKTAIVITEPKSFAAVRTIPLPDFLIEILRPFACSQNAYILSGRSEKYVEPRTMQNRFKAYLNEGQIADANFHSLRHTFATRCIENGFEVKSLSEVLGHASVKITMDRYVHSSMDLKRANMEKLNGIAALL